MATPTTLPAAFVSGAVLTADQMNNLRGAFRVLQVVSATTATAVTNNTNVQADTGLTATITPQSTSSKILVMVSQAGCEKTAGNAKHRQRHTKQHLQTLQTQQELLCKLVRLLHQLLP